MELPVAAARSGHPPAALAAARVPTSSPGAEIERLAIGTGHGEGVALQWSGAACSSPAACLAHARGRPQDSRASD